MAACCCNSAPKVGADVELVRAQPLLVVHVVEGRDLVHRDSLADIHVALESVDRAGAEDDLEGLLEKLEDAVKRARTGGVFGSGAKGHAKALKALREAQGL